MTWQEEGRKLPYDLSKKVVHCGRDASAYVTNTPRGVRLHCFRCGENTFEVHKDRGYKDIIEARRKTNKNMSTYSNDWVNYTCLIDDAPKIAHAYLLRRNMPIEFAKAVGIIYNSEYHALLFPLMTRDNFETGKLARFLDPALKSKCKLIGSKPAFAYTLVSVNQRVLILTEDILSSYTIRRTRLYGVSCAAILGTSIGDREVSHILNYTNEEDIIILWLDDDAAGHKGARKIKKKLGPTGCTIMSIFSGRDPKYHSRKEIESILYEVLGDVDVRPYTAAGS